MRKEGIGVAGDPSRVAAAADPSRTLVKRARPNPLAIGILAIVVVLLIVLTARDTHDGKALQGLPHDGSERPSKTSGASDLALTLCWLGSPEPRSWRAGVFAGELARD